MPKQKKKFIPLPYKELGKDISKYPYVESDRDWETNIAKIVP